MQQRLLVGGPNDGGIVKAAGVLPPSITVLGGQYLQVHISPAVQVYGWSPDAPDRWSRPKRRVVWGVAKRPFGHVRSSR